MPAHTASPIAHTLPNAKGFTVDATTTNTTTDAAQTTLAAFNVADHLDDRTKAAMLQLAKNVV